MKAIGCWLTIASLRIAQVGGRRCVGIGSRAHGHNARGARDARFHFVARTLSVIAAINGRSETRWAVTACHNPPYRQGVEVEAQQAH